MLITACAALIPIFNFQYSVLTLQLLQDDCFIILCNLSKNKVYNLAVWAFKFILATHQNLANFSLIHSNSLKFRSTHSLFILNLEASMTLLTSELPQLQF